MGLIKSVLLWISLLSLVNSALSRYTRNDDEYPCDSLIYCQGDLLHTIQTARLYPDSKSFVDRPLKFSPDEILANFTKFKQQHGPDPSRDSLREFVSGNFEENSTEFVPWKPDDWKEYPKFLEKIKDTDLKQWALELNEFWSHLGRNIKKDVDDRPDYYSMVYVRHPVIVPGGRFKEFYYWDSYWIQEGLLLSEMNNTVKGMIMNFVDMVKKLGFVPNGGRIYYRRSQPPFLIPMAYNYHKLMNDTDPDFIRDNIDTLDKEFQFWITNRTVTVRHSNKDYTMVRYNSIKKHPRPESYWEDYDLAKLLDTEAEKEELYSNLHAGAESGWDFSSKWFFLPKNGSTGDGLRYIRTRDVIPVELNALIYYNAKRMAEFHREVGNARKADNYDGIAEDFRQAINAVLWNETLGCWFDYDLLNNVQRTEFYPTNIVPLWARVHEGSLNVVQRVVSYLRRSGAVSEKSGVPSSLIHSGQQWDYPNGWAPSQSLIIQALERTDDTEAKALAFELAQKWIRTNYKAFCQSDPKAMYEKYDVTVDGLPGSGGEYEVVIGFGWTNGVVLDLLNTYGDRLSADPVDHFSSASRLPPFTALSIVFASLCLLATTVWG